MRAAGPLRARRKNEKRDAAMAQDISKYVEQIVEKLTGDEKLIEKFKSNPVKTVTDLLNIKLDEDALNAIVTAVKGKINLDGLKAQAESVLGGLSGLFGKK